MPWKHENIHNMRFIQELKLKFEKGHDLHAASSVLLIARGPKNNEWQE